MNNLDFADLVKPRQSKVLRLPLKAFSLGHEIILMSERNACLLDQDDFFKEPKSLRRASLIRAVMVCSRDWDENKKPFPWFWLWALLLRGVDIDEEARKFYEYRNAALRLPEISSLKPDDDNENTEQDDIPNEKALGASMLSMVANYASQAFGVDCFDMPYGALRCMFYTDGELKQYWKLKNAFEDQKEAEEKQHRADYEAEQKAKQCQV